MSRREKLLKLLECLQSVRIDKEYFLKYPEAILSLNYVMARFVTHELGFKIKQDDPKVFFSAKYIPEENQIAIHLRTPVKDEWNNLHDFLDIDIYFPRAELDKIKELLKNET